MAVQSTSANFGWGNVGCGYVPVTATGHLYLDSFTSQGLQSNGKIRYTATVRMTISCPPMVWSSGRSTTIVLGASGQSGTHSVSKGCNTQCSNQTGWYCCNCNGYNASASQTFTFELSPSTTSFSYSGNFHSGNYISNTYTIPESMRIVAPTGISLTCPSSLGGNATGSVTKWGDPNGGTFTFKTLNASGSVIGTVTCKTTSTTCTKAMPGTYGKNTRYTMSLTACNTANMCISKSACTLYAKPPCPTVTIRSCVYNPSTKKCKLVFDWSKASDTGTYAETITYSVTDNDGRSYGTGTLASGVYGTAKSGRITLTNIETAVHATVRVTCSSTAGSCTGSASVYSPVAGAAFLGFEWDELRRTCTIKGTAPGAKQTRISGGYAPNNYNIGTKLTPGEFGDLIVKDLKHGNGEILYLECMPEATDNHKYIDEVAKISIPIPNPILGIWTPTCEDLAAGREQQYIVDIIEKKENATTCTPRWNVGDRVVKIAPCNPAQAGHDALPVCNECGPGQDCAY